MLDALQVAGIGDADAFVAALERLALKAGLEILDVRARGVETRIKADSSPVTEADQRAEAVILHGLKELCPDIAVVAEEEAAAGRVPDIDDRPFLLVDPLDGTREFIGGRPDFTVNIALVIGGEPVAGVVHAPACGKIHAGRPGMATAATVVDGAIRARREISGGPLGQPLRIVASKSHRTPQTDQYIARFDGAETVSVGSSLKFCLLAEGDADLYPRLGRTMEWDTAAGDAVLRAAGGMTTIADGRPLSYGKRNQADDCDFANPHFFAATGQAKLLL